MYMYRFSVDTRRSELFLNLSSLMFGGRVVGVDSWFGRNSQRNKGGRRKRWIDRKREGAST